MIEPHRLISLPELVVSTSFRLGGAGLQLGQFEYDKTAYPSKGIVWQVEC